ncbi:MAG: hypothetical protein ACOCVZ_03655 [Gemmatimonadota bacterium]
MKRPEDFDEERRRIVRQVGLISYGLAAAAVFFAILGGALLAWILMGAGFPFLRTWLIVSLLLLAIPAAAHVSPWPRKREPDDDAQDRSCRHKDGHG